MRNLYTIFFLLMTICQTAISQIPDTLWTKTYGGSLDDNAYAICQTFDSSYIVAGTTLSGDGYVHGNHGAEDIWLIKINSSGDTLWTKTLGGSGTDEARAVEQTYDSGFVVAGYTSSTDGDVHGTRGETDFWVVKLNSNGDTSWSKTFGGSSWDQAYSVYQTLDSGFVVAGYSQSNDGDVHGSHGSYDFWIVRLDKDGDTLWTKTLGGSSSDEARSVRQTFDSGFILAGYTKSSDGDVSGFHGGGYKGDFWLVKLDADGDTLWTKTLGGTEDDVAQDVCQASDSGFLAVGTTRSTDGDVSGFNGGYSDAWFVKLNKNGDTLWTKTHGGGSTDRIYSVQETADGGFITVGDRQSQYWVLMLDDTGSIVWSKLGGKFDEYARSVRHTADGNFIFIGFAFTYPGDVPPGYGWYDFRVIEIQGPLASSSSITQTIPLYNGWNIMSFNVSPTDSNMLNIVQPLINSSELVKVIDEAGGIIQNIPGSGWLNTIGDMANTEGYYIKVNQNTQLDLTGLLVATPFAIPLSPGWNIMGYPLNQSQDALSAVQPLIDSSLLVKVVDESGGFIQNIPGIGWINTIGNFNAGEGYYIKVTDSAILTLDNPPLSIAIGPTAGERFPAPYRLTVENPYLPMNIIVTGIEIDGLTVQPGDELLVFNNELLVGSAPVSPESAVVANIAVALDDPLTAVVDGFTEGSQPVFSYFPQGFESSISLEVQPVFGALSFSPLGTLVCTLKGSITDVEENQQPEAGLMCYPNPANDYTTISYLLPETGKVLLEVYDLNGQRMQIIRNEDLSAGSHLVSYETGNLPRGIYIISLRFSAKSQSWQEKIKFVKY